MKKQFIYTLLFFLSIQIIKAQKVSDSDINIQFYQKIKLSDGTKLSANIFKPKDLSKKYPVVLTITPYIADEKSDKGLFFAQNDFIHVVVDSRGRGNSEGEFIPFEDYGKDGYEIVNWIAKQEWCDGNIGMLGGSYRGMNQWLTLKYKPKNLKTIVPIASVGPGRDFPKYNNIFYPYMLRWLMLTSGKTMNPKIFGTNYWKAKQEVLYKNGLPFNKYDSIIGFKSEVFQKWLRHPSHDEYWQSFFLTPKENKAIDIPILSITGHFDSDQPGTMLYYEDHMKHGVQEVKQNHFLILGPWNHRGTRQPKSKLRGLVFDENAIIDMNQLYLNWFNWTLKKKSKPEVLKNRVMYYEMGSNVWKYASSIEDISNNTLDLFLNSNKEASEFAGVLSEQKEKKNTNSTTLKYNPLLNIGLDQPSYKVKSKVAFISNAYKDDKGVLIYDSVPLEEAIVVNGKIKFEAYIEMNVADADLEYSMYEVTKDNRSIFLQKDAMRARYRNGLEKEIKVTKNKVLKYSFEAENFFSRRIAKGSKLRLVFRVADSPNSQKNYNSFKDVSMQSKLDAQEAIIKLHSSRDYPSKISIPVKI